MKSTGNGVVVSFSESTAPVVRAVGTNGFAIASLVLGLLGGNLLAVIFGHVARSQIRRTGESGDGLALAGLILGYVELGALVIVVMGLVSFFGAVYP
jgi:hypothetical protein